MTKCGAPSSVSKATGVVLGRLPSRTTVQWARRSVHRCGVALLLVVVHHVRRVGELGRLERHRARASVPARGRRAGRASWASAGRSTPGTRCSGRGVPSGLTTARPSRSSCWKSERMICWIDAPRLLSRTCEVERVVAAAQRDQLVRVALAGLGLAVLLGGQGRGVDRRRRPW